ncbi:MAG: hypothetical protein Q8P18_20395 [Pseudomonadota bacterium]|nr:hypothetical protein [Pseudomonadota bacterium]
MILLWLLAAAPGCAHRAPAPPTALAARAPRAPLDPACKAALEAGAADLDVAVRRDAIAALLAADPTPAGGEWGQRGRFDPSEYVQRATVAELGARLDEPAARALLRTLVDDAGVSPWVRGAAAIPLARGVRDGGVPADEREADRARLTAAAAQVTGGRGGALLLAAAIAGDTAGHPDPAAARLADQLAAGNLPMELWFFRAIGESGVGSLVAPLTTALERVEPEIQLALAAALLELGGPAGERALVAALAEGGDRALEALEYLADARSPAADVILEGALAGPPGVGDTAALVLFGRGRGDLRDVLRQLAEGEPDGRLLAALAAGRRLRREPTIDGGDRLRAALRSGLPEAAPGLQLAAIEALGGSGVAADQAALTTLLADESVRIRVAAAVALAR